MERDGRFLVVEERIAGRLVFNQPAGHLEDRETLLDAVIREAREETAWRFEPDGAGRHLSLAQSRQRTARFLRFAFCGTVDDHRAGQPLDTGIVRTAVALARADARRSTARLRSPLVLRCIDDYLLGQAPAARLGGLRSISNPRRGSSRRQPVAARGSPPAAVQFAP